MMKRMLLYVLAGWFTAGVSTAVAQTDSLSSPEQQSAKLQARRMKALDDALREFQNDNDQESANFISGIITALKQPGGLAKSALADDLARMKNRVRELVRHGAMESAATLNYAQIQSFYTFDFSSGPPRPNHKISRPPGPGGLVLYLPFDHPPENDLVQDESGAGNDGRVFGAQWIPDGKFGGAYCFSITNFTDRIVVSNSDSLNPEHITVAAWIKAGDNIGFWRRIMDKDFHHGYCLSLAGDLKIEGRPWLETSQGEIGGSRALDDNRWHHVAGTYDGRTVCCYVDGVARSRQAGHGPLGKTGWDLCIGNSVVDYGWGELMAFDGMIDEVRVYNRALSAEEIRVLATATHAGINIVPPATDTMAKPDTAQRLKELQSLYDQGLINKEDYDRKVKEIMDSL